MTAGKARPHQLSSGMRRTMSLDAIIGPYLQGQWPKEPEGQSSLSHKDKSTQVSSGWRVFPKCEHYNAGQFEPELFCPKEINVMHFFSKGVSTLRFFLTFKSLMCLFSVVTVGQMGRLRSGDKFAALADEEVARRWRNGSVQFLHQLLQSENHSHENSQLMRPFWLHPSSLLSGCAGTRHCSKVAHILPPPCYFVFQFLLLFFRSLWSVKRDSVGVDGEMWLQIRLWAWKAVLSVQLFVQYVWSPDVMRDLNVAVSRLRFWDDPKAGSGWMYMLVY